VPETALEVFFMTGPGGIIELSGVVLDSPRPRRLADFYQRLLGWEIGDEDESWVTLLPPAGGTKLSFQLEPDYRPPTWPSETDRQQMMLHLDIAVRDLEKAEQHAVATGATVMSFQPQPDVRVLADPDGHVFCLFT
jgi:predicted enzyme related to lactoylglutathione lyase